MDSIIESKCRKLFTQVFHVTVKKSGRKEEKLGSITFYAVVTFTWGFTSPLHLYAKSKKFEKSLEAEMIREMKGFLKEDVFQNEYLLVTRRFLKEKRAEQLLNKIYRRCYYLDDSMTIFDNLSEQGYISLNKTNLHELHEARIAMETLAEHHALSYAVIQDHQGVDYFLKKFKNLDFDGYLTTKARWRLEPFFENGIRIFIATLKKNPGKGTEEAVSCLEMMKGNGYRMLVESLQKDPDEKLLVLNHGDFSNQNMMFLKDKNTGECIGHKTFDFKATRYNSPAIDLGYYLFMSVQPNVRHSHLQSLLEFYLEVLQISCAALGHPIDMNFEELVRIFPRRFKLGFIFGLANYAERLSLHPALKNDGQSNGLHTLPEDFLNLSLSWFGDELVNVEDSSKNIVTLVNEFNRLKL